MSAEAPMAGMRMRTLLLAIGGLSLVDLAATLAYMSTIGMYEGNPIVRLLAAGPTPALSVAWISLFKAATVATAITLLYRLRRFASARVSALLLAAVLAWVTVQWARYGAAVEELGGIAAPSLAASEGSWVRLR